MNSELAKAILNEAKDRGILEHVFDGKEEEQAQQVLDNAKAAYDKGIKNKDVMVFISLASADVQVSPGSPKTKEERHSFMDEVLSSTNKKSVAVLNNLPEPKGLAGEPPELPGDITQLALEDVRRLHSEFFACYARAAYLLTLKENESESFKAAMDYYEDREISKVEKEVKKMTATSMKALASEREPKISSYKAKWQSARAEARELRGLKEIYDTACNRFSREMSVREFERGSSE